MEYLETGLQPSVFALGGLEDTSIFSHPSRIPSWNGKGDSVKLQFTNIHKTLDFGVTVRWSLDGLPSDELQGRPRPMDEIGKGKIDDEALWMPYV